MAEVRWSLTASRDLQDLEEFIARDFILHAINFSDRIVESAEALQSAPQRGRVVRSLGWHTERPRRTNGGQTERVLSPNTPSVLAPPIPPWERVSLSTV
ncbi:type II toxin-antitoxin system RelE/ParE family toxin [Nitrospira sp. Kam-Ns4a]